MTLVSAEWHKEMQLEERIAELEAEYIECDDAWKRSRKHIQKLEVKCRRYEGALRSIASNTCCEPCQEAKLVARKALEQNND